MMFSVGFKKISATIGQPGAATTAYRNSAMKYVPAAPWDMPTPRTIVHGLGSSFAPNNPNNTLVGRAMDWWSGSKQPGTTAQPAAAPAQAAPVSGSASRVMPDRVGGGLPNAPRPTSASRSMPDTVAGQRAAAAPKPAAPAQAAGGGYKIQKGDTLSSIAKNQGVSVQSLMAMNKGIKDPNKIYAGKSLSLGQGPMSPQLAQRMQSGAKQQAVAAAPKPAAPAGAPTSYSNIPLKQPPAQPARSVAPVAAPARMPMPRPGIMRA